MGCLPSWQMSCELLRSLHSVTVGWHVLEMPIRSLADCVVQPFYTLTDLLSRQSPCLGSAYRSWSTFMCCGFNDSLIFRGFAVFFWSASFIWCQWGSQWCWEDGRGFPKYGCLLSLSGRGRMPTGWKGLPRPSTYCGRIPLTCVLATLCLWTGEGSLRPTVTKELLGWAICCGRTPAAGTTKCPDPSQPRQGRSGHTPANNCWRGFYWSHLLLMPDLLLFDPGRERAYWSCLCC